MSDLQLVSAFDGIGGFPQAFASAGVRTAATIEIDKPAAGVAAEHFPDAAHFADITKVTADDLLGLGLDPVRTVFSAGWPCTDLSLAGLRLGLGGARSGLVGEVFRLLAGLRPRWVVLENVPGLLSSVCPCPGGGACSAAGCADGPHVVRGGACGRRSGGERFHGPGRCMALHGGGMGTVLRRLGECGYGLAYRVLDAQHFGVPQRRRRVVIVGRLGDAAGPGEVLLEPAGGIRDLAARGTAGAGAARVADDGPDGTGGIVANALTRNMAGGGGGADDNPAQGGHLVPVAAEVYRQQGSNVGPMGTMRTGNGNVTGGVPFVAATVTAREGKGPDSDATTTLITHAPTTEGADASEDGTGRRVPLVTVPTLTASVGSNNAQPGNGGKDEMVVPIAYALRADPGGVGGAVAIPATAVRRLTPVECERLQGFPDGWTAKRAELVLSGNRWEASGKVLEQADSARYRQLGNSIAAPVFEWVAEGVRLVDEYAKRNRVE